MIIDKLRLIIPKYQANNLLLSTTYQLCYLGQITRFLNLLVPHWVLTFKMAIII